MTRCVTGGFQCVTAKGSSSAYWIESPGRTIHVDPENDGAKWTEIFPTLLTTVAR